MHTNHKRVGFSISPLITAVAGAVVGAVVMANKKNQDKVKEVVKTVEDKSKKLGDIAKNTVKNVKKL